MTISICLSIIYMLTCVSMEFFLILRRVLTAGEVTGSALVAIPPMGSQLVVSDMLLTVGALSGLLFGISGLLSGISGNVTNTNDFS
jgi:hypothetical protein